ncbi:MAG: NADP-specific glutamate dehydrogenase [Deltaproteobacteria bacterium]|nr:MAG: NADP-specific glutamate dehydrogenase [Deltaproteobacteria bacterium]
MTSLDSLDALLDHIETRDPHQPEFRQAVEEVMGPVFPYLDEHPELIGDGLLARLIEPDRVVQFRVPWIDDKGQVHVERGYRVQFNAALGPYKGGLRFHPSVNLSILKFLAFEQIFKNALTGLPMGGGKGGATFNPRGRSDHEIMRFCQSFMTELFRHLGPTTDVPAGDIGVGGREIGYLFGQYKRLANAFDGTLTGKAVGWGGSELRTEATGYGLIYLAQHALEHRGEALEGKRVAISGSGNVALYAAELAIECGARVLTLSDSDGFVHDPEGLDTEKLDWIKALKQERRGRIHDYAQAFSGVRFHEGQAPWGVEVDLALPCATQNELDDEAARALTHNGCAAVLEGANMPCTAGAVRVLRGASALFVPGKAANAGGVATSGLEMSQNAAHRAWSRDRVERRLREIMAAIHEQCIAYGEGDDGVDYVRGANRAGFVRVARAMQAHGVV